MSKAPTTRSSVALTGKLTTFSSGTSPDKARTVVDFAVPFPLVSERPELRIHDIQNESQLHSGLADNGCKRILMIYMFQSVRLLIS